MAPAKHTSTKPARRAARRGERLVFSFGPSASQGGAGDKDLLGGKGANLAEMCRLGLPVPPGFTISTEVCAHFYANGRSYPRALSGQVDAALALVEREVGKRFGDAKNPLLVSVRSGARVSMPGMLDTVLNLGLNDVTVQRRPGALGRAARGSPGTLTDASSQMFGDVVMGVAGGAEDDFDHVRWTRSRTSSGAAAWPPTQDLDENEDWQERRSADLQGDRTKRTAVGPFPEDPREQL